MTIPEALRRGFVDLACRVSSHRRWDGEYLVSVSIPGGDPQERLMFKSAGEVLITKGDPNVPGGAEGKIRAEVYPDATHRAGGKLVIGIRGDYLYGGSYCVSLPPEFVTQLT